MRFLLLLAFVGCATPRPVKAPCTCCAEISAPGGGMYQIAYEARPELADRSIREQLRILKFARDFSTFSSDEMAEALCRAGWRDEPTVAACTRTVLYLSCQDLGAP